MMNFDEMNFDERMSTEMATIFLCSRQMKRILKTTQIYFF